MSPLKLALLNLWRRKIPSIICLVSIGISIGISGILLRTTNLSEKRFESFGKGGDAIVGAKAGGIEMLLGALNGEGSLPGYIPYALFESMRAEQQGTRSYLRSVIPFLYFAKVKDFRVVATDSSFFQRPVGSDSLKFQSGRQPELLNEVVVGANVRLSMDQIVSGTTWSSGREKSIDFKVVGVLQPTFSAWDHLIYSTVETGHEALALVDLQHLSVWKNKVLNYFLVYLEPSGFSSLYSVINNRTVAQSILIQEEVTKLRELTSVGTKMGLSITFLTHLLGGLTVASTLITRFEAMSLQLAVLRAIGFKKQIIAKWLLWEGFLLGISACVLGVLFDLIGFPIVREFLGSSIPSADLVKSSILESLPVWGIALATTVASVFLPLWRIYHQNVHYSLRS